MKSILEVCLIAVALVVVPSVAAQSAATASDNSAQALNLARATEPTGSGAQSLQKGISVELPVTSSAAPMPAADNEDAWIVTVSADGKTYFGTDPVSPAALEDAMKNRPRNRVQKLYIKADAQVPFSSVATVIHAGRVVGFETPVLLTSQPQPSASGTLVLPRGLEVLVGPALPAGTVVTVVQLLSAGQQRPSVRINRDEISWSALQSTLKQHFQQGNDKLVLLKADMRLTFADVVQAVDTCRAAGAKVVMGAAGP